MERNIEVKIRLFGAMNGGCVLVVISLLFGVGCLSSLSTCLHTNTKVSVNIIVDMNLDSLARDRNLITHVTCHSPN